MNRSSLARTGAFTTYRWLAVNDQSRIADSMAGNIARPSSYDVTALYSLYSGLPVSALYLPAARRGVSASKRPIVGEKRRSGGDIAATPCINSSAQHSMRKSVRRKPKCLRAKPSRQTKESKAKLRVAGSRRRGTERQLRINLLLWRTPPAPLTLSGASYMLRRVTNVAVKASWRQLTAYGTHYSHRRACLLSRRIMPLLFSRHASHTAPSRESNVVAGGDKINPDLCREAWRRITSAALAAATISLNNAPNRYLK